MRKVVALLITGFMFMSSFTAFADDDLEARVAVLEEKVAALEMKLSGSETIETPREELNDQLDSTQSNESEAMPNEYCIENKNCSLQYVDYEIVQDHHGDNVLVTYYDFTNNSEETRSAAWTFSVKVFQHGKETENAYLSKIPAHSDCSAEIMPGTDPLRVAYLDKLDDLSDVIVRVSPLISINNDNYIDIPLTLQ